MYNQIFARIDSVVNDTRNVVVMYPNYWIVVRLYIFHVLLFWILEYSYQVGQQPPIIEIAKFLIVYILMWTIDEMEIQHSS